MAITIGLGAWFGNWMDGKYGTEKPYFTITFVLLAIAIALYQVIKEVTMLSEDDDDEKSKTDEK